MTESVPGNTTHLIQYNHATEVQFKPELPYAPVDNSAERTRTFGGLCSKWASLLAVGSALMACASPFVNAEAADAATTKQATIGMPFAGKWAYDQEVQPPYTDANSSHPSVHNAYGFDWATDLYAAQGTTVKVSGSSSQGAVTFQRIGTSDTCSSYGQGIAGWGVTFSVLVDGAKVGEVKYDHLDLTDVGSDPIASGTKIGAITSEPLNASCYQVRHTHVQLRNTEGNYACYLDKGKTGTNINQGEGIGVVGSSNDGPKQACSGGATSGASSNGQEVTNNVWVYTRAGGSYWPIKPKSQWTSADTAHWGNDPVVVSAAEISSHEAGYDTNGRGVGAHPPTDGTTVYVDGGNGQQYYFVRGKAYPIGVGELADLGVANQALPIPATDNRLADFTSQQLNLDNGEEYRFAGTPAVRQLIYVGSSALSYYVNNDTVKDCLRLTQGRTPLILPQAAQPYMAVSDSGANAGCTFPPGMVLRGPGGQEQWRLEGNNPYVRRYYPSALLAYLHTSGNPNFQELSSAASINTVPQGSDMTAPEGAAFVDMGNGAEFLRQNSEWHHVPRSDMNTCLGIQAWQIVHIPSEAVGALPQGSQAVCTYSNWVLAYNGVNYYVDATGRSHVILDDAVKNCVIARRGTGAVADVSVSPATQYPAGDVAYCPYETEPGLNFVHEGTDPTVWVMEVGQDGKLYKRHAGGFCVPDPQTTQLKRYHLFRVPANETAGIPAGADWYPNGTTCAALPGEGLTVNRFE